MKRRASDGSEWDRLSIPFPIRVMVYTGIGSLTGVMLGMSRGGKMAGLRFRAENAHRQPSTTTGWYLYHKSKNYNVLYGGIGEAFRMAARLGVMIASFTVVEEAVDRLRGHKDFLSTVVAGLGTSGAFSAISTFSRLLGGIFISFDDVVLLLGLFVIHLHTQLVFYDLLPLRLSSHRPINMHHHHPHHHTD